MFSFLPDEGYANLSDIVLTQEIRPHLFHCHSTNHMKSIIRATRHRLGESSQKIVGTLQWHSRSSQSLCSIKLSKTEHCQVTHYATCNSVLPQPMFISQFPGRSLLKLCFTCTCPFTCPFCSYYKICKHPLIQKHSDNEKRQINKQTNKQKQQKHTPLLH